MHHTTLMRIVEHPKHRPEHRKGDVGRHRAMRANPLSERFAIDKCEHHADRAAFVEALVNLDDAWVIEHVEHDAFVAKAPAQIGLLD